jgi:hypothetical protein
MMNNANADISKFDSPFSIPRTRNSQVRNNNPSSINMPNMKRRIIPNRNNQRNDPDLNITTEYPDEIFSFDKAPKAQEYQVPFTSIHPNASGRPNPSLIPGQRHQNLFRSTFRPNLNNWPQTINVAPNTYQVKMLQSIFENTDSNLVMEEKAVLKTPEQIQNAIKKVTNKKFKPKRIDLGEVNCQVVILQNKLWIWNFQNKKVGVLNFDLKITQVHLLKVMGTLLFLWVELENKTANVVQVAQSDENRSDSDSGQKLFLTPLLNNEKSLYALSAKWVEYMNGIIFVNSSKKIGTVVFEEEYGRVNIRLHENPSIKNSGKLKRVKKALSNVFSWRKYYDFKIKILNDHVYILKSSFNLNKKGKFIEIENPLHVDTNNLPDKTIYLRSQSIYNYCMTPRGRLHCKGKLSLKNFFNANRIMLDSHFYASGGFNISTRVVDIHIKDMPRTKLLERSMKKSHNKWDILDITQELGQELHNLSNSPNVNESNMVSVSILLLLENGVEIEVLPYEGLIRKIETLVVFKDENFSTEFLGYLNNKEVLLKQNEDLYMMTR